MKRTKAVLTVAAYVRCSTDEQAREGYTLGTQRARLMALAASKDLTIDRFYEDDGFSAKTLRKRPEMNVLLDDVRAGKVGTVLVAKLDRLFRNTREMLNTLELDFDKNGVKLISASEDLDSSTAAGQMFITMLGGFATFESGRIGERTREVLANKCREQKVYSRNTPFGFVRVGDRLERADSYSILLRIIADHGSGVSLGKIARSLNERNIPTSNGGKAWYPATVKCILENHITEYVRGGR